MREAVRTAHMKSSPRRSHGLPVPLPLPQPGRRPMRRAAWGPLFTSSGESIRPAARFWPLQGQNAWMPHTRRQRVCPGKSFKSSPRRSHGLPVPLPLPQPGRRPMRRAAWGPLFTSSGESIRPAARFWPLQGQNAWMPHTRRQRVCPGKSSKSSPRRSHGLPAPLPLPQLGRPARRRPWAGCSPPTARPPPNRPGHGRQPASWRR